jgi:hypothetical protein
VDGAQILHKPQETISFQLMAANGAKEGRQRRNHRFISRLWA